MQPHVLPSAASTYGTSNCAATTVTTPSSPNPRASPHCCTARSWAFVEPAFDGGADQLVLDGMKAFHHGALILSRRYAQRLARKNRAAIGRRCYRVDGCAHPRA